MDFEKDVYEHKHQVTNGAPWSFSKYWECAIQQYGLPLLHYCISVLYAIYTYCTPLNVVLFFVKSVPTGVYVTKLVKNIYVSSRERMKLKQIEVQDLQLQIQILNTKLSMRDSEFAELTEELRRGAEGIRKVRARVRQVVASSEELRHALSVSTPWEEHSDSNLNSPREEREFIVHLLKELKYDQFGTEDTEPTAMGCGAPSEPGADSVYSSASDADVQQNCRVKIVKVTNVFKVAYLKHYIKQKKLRRTAKRTILKKKVEAVKKLLEDWQHALNMVINSNMSIFHMSSGYEVASQEAMGDFTKLEYFSKTDSDAENFNDNYYEQSILSWAQNSNRNFTSRNFEEAPGTAVSRDPQLEKYQCGGLQQSECSPRPQSALFVLPEETSSQVAIAEVQSEASDEYERRDIVPI